MGPVGPHRYKPFGFIPKPFGFRLRNVFFFVAHGRQPKADDRLLRNVTQIPKGFVYKNPSDFYNVTLNAHTRARTRVRSVAILAIFFAF